MPPKEYTLEELQAMEGAVPPDPNREYTLDELNKMGGQRGVNESAMTRALPGKSAGEKLINLGKGAANVGVHGMDYLSGLARAAAIGIPAQTYKYLSDREAKGGESVGEAIKGLSEAAVAPLTGKFAPSSGEHLRRADIPGLQPREEAPFYKIPTISQLMDPSYLLRFKSAPRTKENPNDIISSLADIGVDVGTGALLEKGGKKVAASVLSKADREALKYGKEILPSQTAEKYGISGSAETIEDQSHALAKDLLDQRNEIVQMATDAGIQVDPKRALSKAREKADFLLSSKDPATRELGTSAHEYLNEIEKNLSATGRPTSVTRKSQFIPQEPIPGEVPMTTAQTSMPSVPEPKPISLITGKPVTTPRHKLPPQAPITPQTRSTTYPEQITGYDPLTGKPSYRTESKPITAFTMGEATQSTPPFKIDQRTGMPVKEIAENRINAIQKTTLNDIQRLKTETYSKAGKESYDRLRDTDGGKQVMQALGVGLKEEVEHGASELGKRMGVPDLGTKVKGLNEDLGSILTTQKTLRSDATREATRLPFTEIDALALGVDPLLYGAKQAGKFAKTAYARTKGGRALSGFGRLLQKTVPGLEATRIMDNENPINFSPYE